MIRSLLTVSSGTLASRLLGFGRDAMIAALLGTGAVADAFLVAFQLVNVSRRLLSEGALNAALVPAWLGLRDSDGEDAAARFAGRVLGTIGAGLLALAVLIGLLMPLLIAALAPGFAGSQTLGLATTFARLMLPYLAFAGPTTVLLALSSAQGRFALTAFSPLLFNIALIAVMVVLSALPHRPDTVATLLAATVGAAGFLQLSVLALRRRGDRLATPLRIAFDAAMGGFLARALPGMVASAAPQLLIVAGAIVASSSPSAVSWLYFANRLIELPLGIVGVAMGTVLIGELTRAVRGGDRAAIAQAESRALELSVGLALPAALALAVLSAPIVQLLFEHGAFTAADAAETAQALVLLALGLPAQVLVKALSPAFFARQDTKAPLAATLTAIAVAVVLSLVLGRLFGAAGIAAAIALGGWSQALALIRSGAASFGFAIEPESRARLSRIAAAAVLMAALLWLAGPFSGALAAAPRGLAQALSLLVLIVAGLALYAVLLAAFGLTGWRQAVAAIRQSSVRDLRA